MMIMLLGVHLLLILIYWLRMVMGRTRIQMTHLLLAAFLPFIGEILLIAAEIGSIPPKPVYSSPFDKNAAKEPVQTNWKLPPDWKDILSGDEEASREFLFRVIDRQPQQMVEVLKTALHANSSEVSHIAAAALMKLNHQHEEAIANASAISEKIPGNAPALARWIDAVKDYRESGLVEGASRIALQEQERCLVERYLKEMPLDQKYIAELAALQGEKA